MATNTEWLDLVQEAAEEPELTICDPHHHLWMSRNHGVEPRYMLEDYLGEIDRSGHNVVSSVYVTCGTMYRADGPDHLRVVGETEFINGMAAASASGTPAGSSRRPCCWTRPTIAWPPTRSRSARLP